MNKTFLQILLLNKKHDRNNGGIVEVIAYDEYAHKNEQSICLSRSSNILLHSGRFEYNNQVSISRTFLRIK